MKYYFSDTQSPLTYATSLYIELTALSEHSKPWTICTEITVVSKFAQVHCIQVYLLKLNDMPLEWQTLNCVIPCVHGIYMIMSIATGSYNVMWVEL